MDAKQKETLKKYIRKLVKEAIEKEETEVEKSSDCEKEEVAEEKKEQLDEKVSNYKTKDGKPVQKEHYAKVLENRKSLIEGMISEKGLMDKLGGMFGKVDPESIVNDPQQVQKLIGAAVAKAQQVGKDFTNKSLNTTSMINAYHDAVLEALEKFATLSDSSPEVKDALQKQVLGVAKQFYQALNNEKGRIESYVKTLANDIKEKGLDKPIVAAMGAKKDNTKISAPAAAPVNKSSFKPKSPSDMGIKGFGPNVPQKSIGKAVGDLATSWAK
jgi:hypothetical protein